MSEWVSQWQGHLLSCSGQLKIKKWRKPTRSPHLEAKVAAPKGESKIEPKEVRLSLRLEIIFESIVSTGPQNPPRITFGLFTLITNSKWGMLYLVSRPTRWSLWYWFYVDHPSYFQTEVKSTWTLRWGSLPPRKECQWWNVFCWGPLPSWFVLQFRIFSCNNVTHWLIGMPKTAPSFPLAFASESEMLRLSNNLPILPIIMISKFLR